jgi:cobyrinic acid a,c-diamide synthase
MTLIIAGERSGVGKTTVTLALLSSLCQKYRDVQSFKVGPDYIDPMFHQRVTGRACRNLDPVLTSPSYVQDCYNRHVQGVDYALIEGVMGLFDGASGRDDWASTAHVARLLDLPVLLVLDCSRVSRSIAAIAFGYKNFDPRIKIAGVVLNRVGSDRHLQLLEDALEPLQLPILGVLRRQDNITIPDRHLGLVPTEEMPQMAALIERFAQLGDSCFDWQRLLPLLVPSQGQGGQGDAAPTVGVRGISKTPIRIAVARDRAFSFYYQDNLDILQQLGAELVFWSPLQDTALPQNVQGLYFGGGFPEVFASQLADNISARDAVKNAVLTNMPTYGECGGLMYLCEQIVDFEGKSWAMAGVLPTTTMMGKRLTVGYRQATALQDSPLVAAAATVWGHEFHHSQLTAMPEKTLYKTQGYDGGKVATEGWQVHCCHASYVHLHWGACPEIPAQFLQHCQQFSEELVVV